MGNKSRLFRPEATIPCFSMPTYIMCPALGTLDIYAVTQSIQVQITLFGRDVQYENTSLTNMAAPIWV